MIGKKSAVRCVACISVTGSNLGRTKLNKAIAWKKLLMIAMVATLPLSSWALFHSWATKTETKTIDGVEYFFIVGGDHYKGDAILENDGDVAVNISDNRSSLTLPDSLAGHQLSVISDHACANLIEVEMIKLPLKLIYIGQRAFEGCSSLKSLTIPPTVKEIHNEAFKDCEKLSTVNLPRGVKLDSRVFSGCTGLEQIDISEAKVWKTIGGMFSGCSSLRSVKLPQNIRSISGTFDGCKKLSDIVIPNEVEEIGSYSFRGCSSLVSLVLPETVTKIEYGAFHGCSSLKRIKIPYRVDCIETGTFAGCIKLEAIEISENITSIGCHAFEGCASLKSVVIPDGVAEILSFAFRDCTSLEEIAIASSVKTISREAFWGCKNIKKVKAPKVLKAQVIKLEVSKAPEIDVKDLSGIKIEFVD